MRNDFFKYNVYDDSDFFYVDPFDKIQEEDRCIYEGHKYDEHGVCYVCSRYRVEDE